MDDILFRVGIAFVVFALFGIELFFEKRKLKKKKDAEIVVTKIEPTF